MKKRALKVERRKRFVVVVCPGQKDWKRQREESRDFHLNLPWSVVVVNVIVNCVGRQKLESASGNRVIILFPSVEAEN